MYRVLTRFFGFVLDLFYRRQTIGSGLPERGPLVVVANHPNGLVDPLLIAHVSDRPVRFLAKEPLFRMPIISALLRIGQALPIYRASDGHDTASNRGTFDAVHAALAQGEVICLFPEGISHNEPSLQPLKTGAARMILGAESENDWSLGVRLLPVGLQYRDKMVFRSEATVVWGDPIDVDPAIRQRYATDPRGAVADLTAQVDEAVRSVTVNLDRWEDLPLLELAGKVWTDDNDPTTRLIGLANGHRSFQGQAPARIERLRRRLENFGEHLSALGLEPQELDGRVRFWPALRFLLILVASLAVGIPIVVLGVMAYCVPYQAVRWLVAWKRPEADIVASIKVLASILFYGAWQALLVTAGVYFGGWQGGLVTGLVLPLAGIVTPGVSEQRQRMWRTLVLALRLPFAKRRRMLLVGERERIRADIEALAREYQAENP